MYQILREEDEMMLSLLGGGFDAQRTPSMSRGEEESVDESKMAETAAVGAGDSGAVTGRSASGVLEYINQTPIDWFSKQQGQVETATYGSEFMVAQQATKRMIDL